MRLELRGDFQTDGLAHISAALHAVHAGGGCPLSDVQLLLPLVERATRLINGFGWKGTARPDEVQFRWDGEIDGAVSGTKGQRGLNCRVWLGGADAGLQLNLQGIEQSKTASSSHCGNDDNGQLVCDDLSDAQYNVALGSMVWYNKNAGGASVKLQPLGGTRRLPAGPTVAMLSVYTGAVRVLPAEPLVLPFRLLLTPVRRRSRSPLAARPSLPAPRCPPLAARPSLPAPRCPLAHRTASRHAVRCGARA